MNDKPTEKKKRSLLPKFLIGSFLLILLVVIVGFVVVITRIDQIARSAIERGGTYVLGVDTSLGSASIGILSGSFSMAGLEVSNPDGFDTPHFLSLDDGGVSVSLGSLQSDVIELPTLELSGIDVYLEKKGGGANYKEILENVKRFESSGGSDTGSKPKGSSSRKFVIRKIVVRDVNAHVDVLPIGGAATRANARIEEIVLTDVGTGGKPVSMDQITSIIMKAILSSIAQLPGGIIPADIAGELDGALAQLKDLSAMGVGMATDIGAQVQNITESVQGATDQVKDAADELQKAGKDVADKAEEAAEEIGNLLGKKKKK